MDKKLPISISLLFFLSAFFVNDLLAVSDSYSNRIQWNSWTDAKSAKSLLLRAQNLGKSYFSQFHVYDIRSKNIYSSHYRKQTGETPYIYAVDFYYAAGSYFTEEYKKKTKKF